MFFEIEKLQPAIPVQADASRRHDPIEFFDRQVTCEKKVSTTTITTGKEKNTICAKWKIRRVKNSLAIIITKVQTKRFYF